MALSPVVDACVFHEWPSLRALAPYMPGDWGALVPEGMATLASPRLYVDPRGAKHVDAVPANGRAGSDRELLTEHLLAGGKRDRVVLGYDDGLFSTVVETRYVADVIAQAANDWTIQEWFPAEERFYGLVMVSTATPQVAAEEIRRVGRHERMVGIALGGNGLSRPFGHPAYHPIYEAACELDLPVVIQAGPSDAFGAAPMSPVAGGYPSTVSEYRSMAWQTHVVHTANMIIEGALTIFPRLKVVLVGGGVTWITGHLLRMDYWYRKNPGEARWLDQLPSECFLDRVRVMTHGLETPPRPELLVPALETIPRIEEILMYGSGYPDADWRESETVAATLPESWHDRVFAQNALDTFRWPDVTRVDDTIARLGAEGA